MKKLDPPVILNEKIICCCDNSRNHIHNEGMKFKIDFVEKTK